jgi:hypothetical protein
VTIVSLAVRIGYSGHSRIRRKQLELSLGREIGKEMAEVLEMLEPRYRAAGPFVERGNR